MKLTFEQVKNILHYEMYVRNGVNFSERVHNATVALFDAEAAVDFHVEIDKDLLPSQEMLDAGGGEGSKRFAEMYIKALQKNK